MELPMQSTTQRPDTQREIEIAQRASHLLENERGVTTRYALAAIDQDVVAEDDLRGYGLLNRDGTTRRSRRTGRPLKRWFLA
jgi:hypothetical protein